MTNGREYIVVRLSGEEPTPPGRIDWGPRDYIPDRLLVDTLCVVLAGSFLWLLGSGA